MKELLEVINTQLMTMSTHEQAQKYVKQKANTIVRQG